MGSPPDNSRDVFEILLTREAELRERHADRYGQLIRMAGMIDQKASSMLTYLAVLLAGVSVLLVGGTDTGLPRGAYGLLLAFEFGVVFFAAFLFLSAAQVTSMRPMLRPTTDETMVAMQQLIGGRVKRFRLGYWLTIFASAMFAALILARIVGQYFL